jgi:hypothetical protein
MGTTTLQGGSWWDIVVKMLGVEEQWTTFACFLRTTVCVRDKEKLRKSSENG